RGRALEPLIAAGVTRDNVMEQAGYLCGACSCEVKEQNPGMDLLMAANWQPVDTTPQIEIVSISPEVQPAPAATRQFPIALVAVGIFVIAVGALVLRRMNQSSGGPLQRHPRAVL